jgi:hypothetical protein
MSLKVGDIVLINDYADIGIAICEIDSFYNYEYQVFLNVLSNKSNYRKSFPNGPDIVRFINRVTPISLTHLERILYNIE